MGVWKDKWVQTYRLNMSLSLSPLLRVISAAALIFLALASLVAAQGSYKIRAGDVLSIEVLEDSSLNRSALVLPDGTITFPLVGTVQAGGGTVAQLSAALAAGLASNFAVSPNVFVTISSLVERRATGNGAPRPPETVSTFIMGEVASPGKIEVEPGTTILQLLAQAGGPTRFAAERRIELRRTDAKTGVVSRYLFSYTGFAKGPRISGATVLVEGDVVVVPERRLFE